MSLVLAVNVSSISISASSAVVMDMASSKLLYDYNSNLQRSIASTTKIMTCYIACKSGKLKNTVTITQQMLNGTYGSLIYLNVGDKITLLDLVKGAMLASGNDAANAIAFYLGGSAKEFAKIMNTTAKTLGMYNTNYVSPSGLDNDNQYSTSYDLAVLTKNALQNKCFKTICSKSSDTIKINNTAQTIYNHNKLLQYDNFIGVKTGFTDSAGRCLVSAYNYNGNIIIVVTLNDGNDWADHLKLVKYAIKNYKHYSNKKLFTIDVVGGIVNKVSAYAYYDIYTLYDIKVKSYYYPFIYAPYSKGQTVGKLVIYANNKQIKTVDIIVGEDVKIGK